MKIKTKLLLGLSTFPILILIIIGIGWFQLSSIHKMNNITQNGYDLSSLAGDIHIGVKNQAISIRNLVLNDEDGKIQSELNDLEKESESVTKKISELASKASPEEKDMITALEDINQSFDEYKNSLIVLVSEGKDQEAIDFVNENGQMIHDEFFNVTSEITTHYELINKKAFANFTQNYQQNMMIGSIVAFISLLLVTGLITRLIWNLANRLNRVSKVMGDVSKGNLEISTRVEVQANDEIGEVSTSFNTMLGSLEEQMQKEQNLNWSKSNLADVTTSLYGKHDLESLSRTLLSKIAPLTESGHAVIYVKNMDRQQQGKAPKYQLLASYGFKERKNLSISFAPGEGLVGQAVLEKTPIILTNVPSDYVQINSGLGEATPLNLYVLPVLYEGDVKAVLEIAAFKPFNEIQQAFLEEVVSGLGIIIDSVMSRIQLTKVLEETQTLMEEIQAQSEELQAQQEELRVTNEELEEQTQALRKSEERLQLQQEELEQTNEELVEKASRLEEQNEKFEITNQEMAKARAELEEKARQLAISSKYKSEFLANMSHELRTPLNSLLILSKLLADNKNGNLSEKQVEYSKTIYSSGQDLLILINDILDLTKIESGKMEVVKGRVAIKDLAKFAEQRFKPIANEKNVAFHIEIKEGTPSFIHSDEQRLKQVLKNLLSNAFKFTHKGEVRLEMNYDNGFTFAVIDTGIGIAADKQELIFQAFQQADGTTSRRYGGTGLGLSICREISTLLGGEIVVDSVEGKGSTFTFYVDDYQVRSQDLLVDEVAVALAKEESREVMPEQIRHQALYDNESDFPVEQNKDIKRLLIVDDDLGQRNSLMELIGSMDVIIKAVSTGKEAVEELKVNQLDCLVLDLGLQDTNGFQLLEEIKPYILNNNLKVFIYTGRDLSSKDEMYLNKYSHTIIIKDEHSPERLVEELELFLSSPDKINEEDVERINTNHNKSLPALKGKKILLVDDDVRNIYAISSILEMHGLNIVFAENGAESLELIKETPDFDLVLMDIMMPEMDGYEAIRRIRAQEEFNQLPIIALTAKAMKEDREKCLAAGASDYIAKPVDPDKLVSLMAVWLYQQEGK